MRKIIHAIGIDPVSFQPQSLVVLKKENGTSVELERKVLEAIPSKYTAEEQRRIDHCNSVLSKHDMPPLTEEEADFMLDPNGAKKRLAELEEAMNDPEKLQALSGFKVEKRIIPL
jgi:hypothetical protein